MIIIRYGISDSAQSALRAAYLDDHKHWLRTLPVKILLSGPFSGGNSGSDGALIIAEAQSLYAFAAISAEDPFVVHGVYSSVDILEWHPTLGPLLPLL